LAIKLSAHIAKIITITIIINIKPCYIRKKLSLL